MLKIIAVNIFLLISIVFGVNQKSIEIKPVLTTQKITTQRQITATSTKSITPTKKPAITPTLRPNTSEVGAPTVSVGATPSKPVVSQEPKVVIETLPHGSASVPQPSASVDFEAINTFVRKATVNILCQTKASDFSPISGTGMIISQDGLILTNAHVAQYFLLRDLYTKNFIECVIRTGSPAYPRYRAELVYISPAWVETNKAEIRLQNPLGTGEKDFAFLRITDTVDNSKLPVFPFVLPDVREKINVNEPVVLVSYPAGFLGGLSIIQNLNITSAVTTIQDVFTFKENTIDVVAVGGTVISQKGASGGAIVDENSSLLGIISTSSDGLTTSSRSLNAITLAYINRSLQDEINMTLSDFLAQDLTNFAKNFQETTAVNLTKILTDEITKN